MLYCLSDQSWFARPLSKSYDVWFLFSQHTTQGLQFLLIFILKFCGLILSIKIGRKSLAQYLRFILSLFLDYFNVDGFRDQPVFIHIKLALNSGLASSSNYLLYKLKLAAHNFSQKWLDELHEFHDFAGHLIWLFEPIDFKEVCAYFLFIWLINCEVIKAIDRYLLIFYLMVDQHEQILLATILNWAGLVY